MAKNKWMQQLAALEGAVTEQTDPFAYTLQTPSPSVNFVFGKGWGIPLGYTAVVYGPPKGGKTIYSHMVAGMLHQNNPEALVVKFDTEFRSEGQLTEDSAKLFGIDLDRIQPIMTNKPAGIFDQIEKKVAAMCENGAPVKLVIIDSLYGIQGRREADAESVDKQIIGDHAATIQAGLKRILPVQRQHKFAVILIDQVRSEMDTTEQMRGNKFKMRAAFAVQHHAEYFIACEENLNKAGRSDLAGNEFVDDSVEDMAGKGDVVAKKFKIKMRASSMGEAGRTGEYTFGFKGAKRGLINVHEEVFRLAVGRNIFHRPNNIMYEFGGQSWRGTQATLDALEKSPDLQKAIIAELHRRDLAGEIKTVGEE